MVNPAQKSKINKTIKNKNIIFVLFSISQIYETNHILLIWNFKLSIWKLIYQDAFGLVILFRNPFLRFECKTKFRIPYLIEAINCDSGNFLKTTQFDKPSTQKCVVLRSSHLTINRGTTVSYSNWQIKGHYLTESANDSAPKNRRIVEEESITNNLTECSTAYTTVYKVFSFYIPELLIVIINKEYTYISGKERILITTTTILLMAKAIHLHLEPPVLD